MRGEREALLLFSVSISSSPHVKNAMFIYLHDSDTTKTQKLTNSLYGKKLTKGGNGVFVASGKKLAIALTHGAVGSSIRSVFSGEYYERSSSISDDKLPKNFRSFIFFFLKKKKKQGKAGFATTGKNCPRRLLYVCSPRIRSDSHTTTKRTKEHPV